MIWSVVWGGDLYPQTYTPNVIFRKWSGNRGLLPRLGTGNTVFLLCSCVHRYRPDRSPSIIQTIDVFYSPDDIRKGENISQQNKDGNAILEELLQLMRKQDAIISNP